MPDVEVPAILELRGIKKNYGGLRPLRLLELRVPASGRVTVLGFDRVAAEVLVNLVIGASLPEEGEVLSLGRHTGSIADGEDWLAFAENFGIVSDRVVLLDGMTVAQNLAIPFTLDVDPVPPAFLTRVQALADEVGLSGPTLDGQVAASGPEVRARVRLARALALAPGLLLLEHPTASLPPPAVAAYAADVARATSARAMAVLALTADVEFARALGGRLLTWQPATGECRERRRWW